MLRVVLVTVAAFLGAATASPASCGTCIRAVRALTEMFSEMSPWAELLGGSAVSDAILLQSPQAAGADATLLGAVRDLQFRGSFIETAAAGPL